MERLHGVAVAVKPRRRRPSVLAQLKAGAKPEALLLLALTEHVLKERAKRKTA